MIFGREKNCFDKLKKIPAAKTALIPAARRRREDKLWAPKQKQLKSMRVAAGRWGRNHSGEIVAA